MIQRIVIFLVINFAALAIGGVFTGKGVPSEWYTELNKAPWTPPGWVFGAAWTTIMICFSIYMAQAWEVVENQKVLMILFGVQWVLNVIWNPVFFHFHALLMGWIVIAALTLLVGWFLFRYWPEMKWFSMLIAPYFIWLVIATSLNGFAWLNN